MQVSNTAKIEHFSQLLEKSPLPVLESSLIQSRVELAKAHFNYEMLSHAIKNDPLLVFNFMSFANRQKSKLNSADDKVIDKIKTPKHAAMLLGIDQIHSFILSLKPLKTIKDKKIRAKIEQIVYRSIHCAHQAKNLACLMHDKSDEIFYSAILMSLPDIMVWYLMPEKAQKYELLIYQEKQSEEEAQLKIFGFKFNDLMHYLNEKIQLADLYIKAIQTDTLDEAKNAIVAINLAHKLSKHVDFGWYYQDIYDYLDYCELITPFKSQRLCKEFHHVATNMIDEVSDYYQQALPLQYLALQAGKVPYYPVINFANGLTTDKVKASLTNKAVSKEATIQEPTQKTSSINLETANNLPSLIQLTISKLFQTKYFEQIYLLMLDKSKKDLTIRIEKSINDNSLLHKKINVERKNLFRLLLQKPQPIHVKESEAQKYTNLLTPEITEILPSKEFFANAFHYKNKPIGIFYTSSSKIMDEKSFKLFRTTIVEFEKNLSRM